MLRRSCKCYRIRVHIGNILSSVGGKDFTANNSSGMFCEPYDIPLYLFSRKEFSVAPQSNSSKPSGSTGKPPDSGSNLSKVFIGSLAIGAAALTAYQTGYLETFLTKEQNNDLNTHEIPIVHEEPQQPKTVNGDLHDGETVEPVAVQNVQESEVSNPTVEHGEKNIHIDPYYSRREEEAQSELKELPISKPHDAISEQESKLPSLDHSISTAHDSSFDSIPLIQEDLGTKNQDVKPTIERHEGVQITSIPTQVAPVIEENMIKSEQPQQLGTINMPERILSNDVKEPNSLLDAYLLRGKAEQTAAASSYLHKDIAETVKGTNDVYVSKDGKVVLDLLEAIHTAERRQEKYEKELKDARARELMYAERETILDKELHKEKLKAAAALKSLQEMLEEEFRMEIERKESETEFELNKLKDLAKAELTAGIASEKASQIERMEEANLNGALALEDALSKGLPIQKEIDALNSYIDGIDKDSLLGLVMASLPEDTLKNGTDTILQLNHKFDGLKGTLRHFSLMPPGGGGILAHSLAYIASNLKVKEADKSGDGIESLINRVESLLADGKLLEAAETLEDGLKGSQAAEVVGDWVQQARNRAITEQALTLLQSYATSVSLS
ncbi:Mitochondrial inner membrane protein Mitofilin [Cynara cardunculus var. scolymus]|uniref:Mitochondrial inner membrane protein Mitofilin n=1 Tax=Cynara cardunculus var. scolymus TaxID=59895 RepID=A0A103XAZ9_CYNCS|nr:Mitochondrial inner membrane protein Mitofilin [Cynara cardunculus var. scolymus]